MYENYDLENIVTPIDVGKYYKLLKNSGFDKQKSRFLCKGFKNGFYIGYEGDLDVAITAPNLPLTLGTKVDLWNKVMVEVEAKRYAGPFIEVPYKNFIQSPIGLVPKDGGKKTRLIFHLSYPKSGTTSVNANIPKEKCSVKYPDFTDAVKMCLQAGKNCAAAKSDMSRAFRNVPLHRNSWKFLIMKCENPQDGLTYWFMEKCLPFGLSISCAIFQLISDSIAHIVYGITLYPVLNYLDDYFFVALFKNHCDQQVMVFLKVCWGSTCLTFLGMLLNTEDQSISIPFEKIQKALKWIEYFLNKINKKATVKEFQKLTGTLNFLCKGIVPGRAFTRRLYAGYSSKLLPDHHIRITAENRMDLQVWREFILSPHIFNRPFMDMAKHNAEKLDIYSDASGGLNKGFGAYCRKNWIARKWDSKFMTIYKPSIQYLELYAVTVAVLLWIRNFSNRRIILFCDNESVCKMINNSTSGCKNCMVLIRFIIFESMIRNV